jgi:D-amino-acid oxidase
MPEIVILGGGVTGVTAGIVLQLLGFSTHIVCRHWIGDLDEAASPGSRRPSDSDPRFASQYPAASIIPHSVNIPNEQWHLQTSQQMFEALQVIPASGVRWQRHFELFEGAAQVPSYATSLRNFRPIDPSETAADGLILPQRHAEVPVHGWSFDTLFAQMPLYRCFLVRFYEHLGGRVTQGRYWTSAELLRLPGDMLINCAGAWGAGFWGDPVPSRFVKGTLVRIDATSLPDSVRNQSPVSYNYHPLPTIYSRRDGTAADVYFYPRDDAWLLGGTRLESEPLSADDTAPNDTLPAWHGETWNGAVVELPSSQSGNRNVCRVPEPILSLNQILIEQLTGIDIRNCPMTATMGYRHRRDTVRLEQQLWHNRQLIHNYGHGGAGVTLSWSTALHCAQWLQSGIKGDDLPHHVKELLSRAMKSIW